MKIVPITLLLCAVAGTASAVTIATVDRNQNAPIPAQTVDLQAHFENVCLHQTGSTLVAAPESMGGQRCVTADGRSFSRGDLNRAEANMRGVIR